MWAADALFLCGSWASCMSFIWPHPYSTPSWGCFRCTRPLLLGSVRVGTLSYSAVQLFSKYSNLCENHTDGQTACNLITTLCIALRDNKRYISAYTLYFFRNYTPGLHSAADNISLSFVEIFIVGAGMFVNFGERGVSPVQGHPRSLPWCQSKARIRLPISP